MSANSVLFSILPAADPRLALDVKSASDSKGAEVIVYPFNDANNQKFEITSAGSGHYYITALHSMKQVVTKESASDGDGVWQWVGENANWSKWDIVAVTSGGTQEKVVIDGAEYGVYTISPCAGTGLLMDCYQAMTDGLVRTCAAESGLPRSEYQKWVLVPATRYYADGPVPYGGGASFEGSTDTFTVCASSGSSIYPSFRVPSSWLTTNTYFWRQRSRCLLPNDTWTEWGAPSAWATPTTVTSGDRVWIGSPLATTLQQSDASAANYGKRKQYYVEVCCQGTWTDTYTYYGPVYGFVLDVCKAPALSFSDAEFSPLGLKLSVKTDYLCGSNRLVLTKVNGWAGSYAFENITNTISGNEQRTQDILLPLDTFGAFAKNEEVQLEWYVGTDQHNLFPEKHDTSSYGASGQPAKLKVSYYTGGTLTVNASVQTDEWGVMTVVAKNGNTLYPDSRVVLYAGGELVDFTALGNAEFRGMAPMGAATLFVMSRYTSGGTALWGIQAIELSAGTFSPAHAIATEDGRLLVIGMRAGDPPMDELSVSASYESNAFDAREHPAYRAAVCKKVAIAVEGTLISGEAGVTVEYIEGLVGEHVTYRNLKGMMRNCFVESARAIERNTRIDVSLSLGAETV